MRRATLINFVSEVAVIVGVLYIIGVTFSRNLELGVILLVLGLAIMTVTEIMQRRDQQ